jgi:hypothetical protein
MMIRILPVVVDVPLSVPSYTSDWERLMWLKHVNATDGSMQTNNANADMLAPQT